MTEAAEDTQKAKPHYLGHRERLRARFLQVGAEALANYELLELLLTLVIPRRDTKPLAKRLLERYGTLAALFAADHAFLAQEAGLSEISAASLKILHAAALRAIRSELKTRPVINSWDRLIDYCLGSMGHEKNEQFRILFLDTKLKLMTDEVQQRGTVDQTPVYPRESGPAGAGAGGLHPDHRPQPPFGGPRAFRRRP